MDGWVFCKHCRKHGNEEMIGKYVKGRVASIRNCTVTINWSYSDEVGTKYPVRLRRGSIFSV